MTAVLVCVGCCVLTIAAMAAVHLVESDRDADWIAWAAWVPGAVSFLVGMVNA